MEILSSHTPTLALAEEIVNSLWSLAGLDTTATEMLSLDGHDPVMPSSFSIGLPAQSSIAASALAAAELRAVRGQGRQRVGVSMLHAAVECSNFMSLDGVIPEVWDKFSGLYPCGKDAQHGWVRIHANFKHHREGALALLGLSASETTTKEDVVAALARVNSLEFEQRASEKGLVVAALRSFDEWDATEQAKAIASLPLFTIEKVGEADPLPLPALQKSDRPLTGIRVLDLTRVLAGPVAGRTLAAYGADVMLVNSPNLPNIDAIAETSRGKLSAHVDLSTPDGRKLLAHLSTQAHVFMQGYRPGGLASLGIGVDSLARLRPGMVYVSLSAYSHEGPWAGRRGFDSLVQTATGFNHAEAMAASCNTPKALPVQILDHATGYLMALGAQAAMIRQQQEGGSWHVQVSLAQTAHWLRSLGRVSNGLACPKPDINGFLEATESGYGRLVAVRHSAQFSETPAAWTRPSMPPGSHRPVWPEPPSSK
jgi:crotonobetainyl-CoA:carnitine CoA-transferase CaiB-like acyl-CoA transferase